jgi:hypothetical protein
VLVSIRGPFCGIIKQNSGIFFAGTDRENSTAISWSENISNDEQRLSSASLRSMRN